MKNVFVFIGIAMIVFSCAKKQDEDPNQTPAPPDAPEAIVRSVLFLGNSYTYHNSLPNLTTLLAKSAGDSLITDSITPGGVGLKDHAQSAVTYEKIFSEQWDFVTIQGQSQETSLDFISVQNNVFPFAKKICDSVKFNNSMPLFYMTWGRKNGDDWNCPYYHWVCTYAGMDDTIRANYIKMGNFNLSWISPVGAVWRHLRENYPELELYISDGSHPSIIGTYAAACSFYTMIFEKDPILIKYDDKEIPDDMEFIIKNAAKSVVFEHMESWKYN